jgi:hypothetical protein
MLHESVGHPEKQVPVVVCEAVVVVVVVVVAGIGPLE